MRRRTRRTLVLGVLLAITATGALAVGVGGAVESWTFYFPSRRAFADPPGVEAVTFPTTDGLRLSAWYWHAAVPEKSDAPPYTHGPIPPDWTPPAPNADGARPTILVAHGNAGCLPDHDEFCSFLADYGFNVLLFDYRGYGRSDLPRRGLRRDDLVLDAQGALDYLLTREDVDPDRIALLGYSLGGNIGLGLAAREPRVKAVATLSTFATWKQVASDHAGMLGRWLIPDGLDAAESVTHLGDRPLLIVHGDNDDIVPYRHAGLLEAAAQDAGVHVSRITVHGANHLDMTDDPGVQRAIAAFFAESLSPLDPPADAAPDGRTPTTPTEAP